MSAALNTQPTQPITTNARKLFGLLCRIVVAAVILGALSFRYGTELVEALLPAIRAEFEWLDDTYDIKQLYLDHVGADQVVRVVVGQARCIVLIDRAFCGDPRGRANASTLIGNITLPAVVLLALALAWPSMRICELACRLVLAPMALAMMWSLDVPFILWSSIWSLHVDAFAPGLFSPLLIWSQFLQGGGRFALAGLLGIGLATLSTWLMTRRMQRRN